MGLCKYCGEKAGIFSSKHKICEQKNQSAISTIVELGREAINSEKNLLQLQADIEKVADDGFLPKQEIGELLVRSWEKSDSVVWLFQNVTYYEDKNKVSYVGGSTGGSVRVAKGVYLRHSAFKGHRVETTERELVDEGLLVLTNKHIYFGGPRKSFKIPYKKIVSFTPFESGFGVVRDAQTAKPQIFFDGDGWFSYNLVTNLAQMDQT